MQSHLSSHDMAIAALTMYGDPPAVAQAYKDLAAEVAKRLDLRLEDSPSDLASLWRHPDLLLSQTCGYPWATQLKDKVRIVAAPHYDFPGCERATHCSFILVPESSSASSLADLRDLRVAINSQDSNSGMNLLRHTIAPLAVDGRFFSEVLESGSHANSIAMLKQGAADVAAVDAVTYGYLHRDLPDRVVGLRVLARTRQSPSLPFITAAGHNDEMIRNLRDALQITLAERKDLAATLSLRGVEFVDQATYLPVLEWEREAIDRGFPIVA
jgi:ABC-type phosphate/phosphonate transport system substrate-binding protein